MKIKDFPQEVFAHACDTNSTCGYSTPLRDKTDIDRNVEHYKTIDTVTEIRVARYVLQSVDIVYKKEG